MKKFFNSLPSICLTVGTLMFLVPLTLLAVNESKQPANAKPVDYFQVWKDKVNHEHAIAKKMHTVD